MRKNERTYKLILASIVGIGISSIANQILIIREFLSQFHGNEITISVVIFCWLMVGGCGSLFSRLSQKGSISLYALLVFFAAILPLVQLILIRILRDMVFIHGSSAGFYPILLYIFSMTFFYCFLIGLVLPYSQKAVAKTGHSLDTGLLYLVDNIGDITGGALLSFFLIYLFRPFSIIALTSISLILISLVMLYYQKRLILFVSCAAISVLFLAYSLNGSFEKKTLAPQYGNIIEYMESPYGRIVITGEDAQYTFWESGSPLYFEQDIARSEEKVHYTLSQLNLVRNVLLISGGLGRTIKEIQKYHPEHIDYVELDPYITDAGLRLHIIQRSPNLSIINTDGRYYIENLRSRLYDAIIIDLPEPDTFQINRFFTKEFFAKAKSCLTKQGVISISMEYSPNYIGMIRKKKISIIYNTLKACFKNVILIPGQSLYFIAKDRRLYMNIPQRLRKKAIKTLYAGPYFYGNVTPDRIRYLLDITGTDKRINLDLKPCLVSIMLAEWFEKFHTSPKYFFALFFALAFIYLVLIRREEYVLFSTGLSLMGLEMLIIFTFQIIYGYIYLRVGAIITVFLLGLLPGSILGIRAKRRLKTRLLLSELIILLMLLAYFMALSHIEEVPYLLFFIYPFFFSLVCGFQFPVIARIIGEERSPAASLFAADLIGASIGTILIGIILVPFYGIRYAILCIALFKITSICVSFFIKERQT